jgi:putative flavoprotein involved in K+ transport
MSRCLADRSIDHVVLERGEVANTWKNERWDSLRLLTPNWQSRLPGYAYEGDDPHGFRTMPETIDLIERYAEEISAPVRTNCRVTSVCGIDGGYSVTTDQGEWQCRTVVIATGACNIANVPAVAEGVPSSIATLTSIRYRNPDQVEQGGVLVVGASASGTQIADEIHRSGRPVTLSVGEHIRVPRVYRGKDIKWWMDAAGVLDEFYTEVDNIDRVRNVPSLQLAGSDDRRTVDLNSLTDIGVKLIGRLAGMNDGKAQFSGSLRNKCEMSDLKMNRLLDRIDEWAAEHSSNGEVGPPQRFEPTRVEESAGLRPQGPHPARRWCRRGPRHVPDGHAVPPPPQVESDRWRRRRCA